MFTPPFLYIKMAILLILSVKYEFFHQINQPLGEIQRSVVLFNHASVHSRRPGIYNKRVRKDGVKTISAPRYCNENIRN